MTDIEVPQAAAESARLFRSILSAFAKPAVPVSLPGCAAAPSPLLPAAASVVLSLCDFLTPVWLSPSLDHDHVRKFIRFYTGAPLTAKPADAAFALLDMEEALFFMNRLPLGTDEYPDRSATLIVQTAGFEAEHTVRAEGPGLKHSVEFAAAGTSAAFWRRVQDNAQLFPTGLDFIFAAPHAIAALPRSLSVTLKDHA